uniref:SAM domain-containing protein n=1 Tax=Heterorhabditis bacteriophora TaxID=37862 RepID=A0A1I7WE62_HETBA
MNERESEGSGSAPTRRPTLVAMVPQHLPVLISNYRGPEMTPFVQRILEQPEFFYHVGQQSAKVPVDTERVTLTMEINHNDFEEIFTKKGLWRHSESCAGIMKDTNTIIQFPDRDEQNLDLIHQAPVIRITGRVGDEEVILQACELLRHLLFEPEIAEKVTFSSHLEVPTSQRAQLVGVPDGTQLLAISHHTKALLHFPANSDESSPTLFFYITGKPGAVLQARRFMQVEAYFDLNTLIPFFSEGLQPMQLCFHAGNSDLRAPIEKDARIIQFYDKPSRVSVRVVPSDLESVNQLPGDEMRVGNIVWFTVCLIDIMSNELLRNIILFSLFQHFISLRTSEYNVGALYAVMRRILKYGEKMPILKPTDYAEINPLIPELSKYATEVDVRCRLEPQPLELPPISCSTEITSSSAHISSKPQKENIRPISQDQNIDGNQTPIPSDFAPDSSTDTSSHGFGRHIKTPDYFSRAPTPPNDRRCRSPPQEKDSRAHFHNEREYYNRERSSYHYRHHQSGVRSRHSSGERRPHSQITRSRYGISNGQKHQLALRPRNSNEIVVDEQERYIHETSNNTLADHRLPLPSVLDYVDRRKYPAGDRFGPNDRRNGDSHSNGRPPRAEEYGTYGGHTGKTVLPQRNRSASRIIEKVELQRRSPVKDISLESDSGSSYADMARRMDVMDLIMLASEDPQSVERNREMKEEADESRHRTYAEILEGKRQKEEQTDEPTETFPMVLHILMEKPLFRLSTSPNTSHLFYSSACVSSTMGSVHPAEPVSDQDTARYLLKNSKFDVSDVLALLNCQKYVAAFRAANIDMNTFCHLQDDDLLRLGVVSDQARKDILSAAYHTVIPAW